MTLPNNPFAAASGVPQPSQEPAEASSLPAPTGAPVMVEPAAAPHGAAPRYNRCSELVAILARTHWRVDGHRL
jgi:hypothetical protein